jgi:hypothetical protein
MTVFNDKVIRLDLPSPDPAIHQQHSCKSGGQTRAKTNWVVICVIFSELSHLLLFGNAHFELLRAAGATSRYYDLKMNKTGETYFASFLFI